MASVAQSFDSQILIYISETLLFHIMNTLSQKDLTICALVCQKWRLVSRRCVRSVAFNQDYARACRVEWPGPSSPIPPPDRKTSPLVTAEMVRRAAAAFPLASSIVLSGCHIADGAIAALERFAKLASIDLTAARGVKGEMLPEQLSVAPSLRQIKVCSAPPCVCRGSCHASMH